jgi:NAD(P)H-flavin reductase
MRIRRVTQELSDVFTWDLEPPGPFEFNPGQFNMIYAHGVGEVPISMSGGAADPSFVRHTIRVVGRVTEVLGRLREGDEVGVRGPYGTGWPVDSARGQDLLFVAGGLGLAPLRPAILEVLANRGDYGDITIIYGARSPSDILFRRELERWRGRFDLKVDAIVDHAGRDWYGAVGVVTRLVNALDIDADNCVAMLCGPEVMMRFTVRELEQLGLDSSQVWVSLERSMRCAVALCGHCQLGGTFVCREGPVYRYDRVADMLVVRGL